MIRGFIKSDKRLIEEYTVKRRRLKWIGFTASPILILLGLVVDWGDVFFYLAAFAAMMPWMHYFVSHDGLKRWKKELQENAQYLHELKLRLQHFDTNNQTCVV